jgi:hypothetical protein
MVTMPKNIGVHFAITKEEETRCLRAKTDDVLDGIVKELCARWDELHLYKSDNAWDSIHRCLTDGYLRIKSGDYPLNRCILGGIHLHNNDRYLVVYISPSEVHDIANALAKIEEDWLHERYDKLVYTDYPKQFIGEDDFEYTWTHIQGLKQFFRKAAVDNRAVIFTADQ